MKMILFICTGNTCRSPMAEIIFNDLIKKHENLNYCADSAGIFAYNQNKISENAKQILIENHIKVPDLILSTLLTRELLETCEYAYVMEQAHKDYIKENFPEFIHKCFLLSEIDNEFIDIQDPISSDLEYYQKTYLKIRNYLEHLINKLEHEEKIVLK